MSAFAAPVTLVSSVHGGHAVARTCPSSRQLKHCKGLLGMAMTVAVDQPRMTLPVWASFRAPATGHLIQADPRPFLEVSDLPDLHLRAAASCGLCQCLPQFLLVYRDIYSDNSQLRRPRWSRHSRRGRV